MAKATQTHEKEAQLNTSGDDGASKGEIINRTMGSEVEVYDFGDDAGKGMENIGLGEYKVPFLRVLGTGSPETYPPANGGIDGAKPGDFLVVGSREIWKPGFIWIPVDRRHEFIEWIPKDDHGKGGGFVGTHAPDEAFVGELRDVHGKFGKLPMDNGHELAETFTIYALALKEEGDFPMPCQVSFSSSMIPVYQDFIRRQMSYKYGPAHQSPPMWGHQWLMGSRMFFGKGFSWQGYDITLRGMDEKGKESPRASLMSPKHELYVAAKEFHRLINSGAIKTDYSQMQQDDKAKPASRVPGEDGEDIPM